MLEREAPGLILGMLAVNRDKGRLSRNAAGTIGRCIVLNTPGSPTGAVECLSGVLDILPHALRLLADEPTSHHT